MRAKVSNILWGLILVALGVLLVGRIAFDWNFTLFFPGWWTLFIIIPASLSMIRHGFGNISTAALAIGIMFLLQQTGIWSVETSVIWKLIIPIILLIVGINIIAKSFFASTRSYSETVKNNKKVEYASVFSSNNYAPGPDFYGCEIDSVFGSSTLTLCNANISENVPINITSVFGSTDVYFPKNVNVKVVSTDIFGGVTNKTITCPDATATVYVDATCLFGGVTLQ